MSTNDVSRDNWKYISRYMRENGYTVDAIQGTLLNLGKRIPLSTLYRNLEGITASSPEWEEKYTEPLSMYAILKKVLEYEEIEIPDSHSEPVSDYIVATISSSVPVFDLSGHRAALGISNNRRYSEEVGQDAGFEFFYPQGPNGSGIKTYIHRCNNQDREMMKLPVWSTDG
jgi:hypothetical protein